MRYSNKYISDRRRVESFVKVHKGLRSRKMIKASLNSVTGLVGAVIVIMGYFGIGMSIHMIVSLIGA